MILIDMDMPDSCHDCKLFDYSRHRCRISRECPLIPLGDWCVVDADRLCETILDDRQDNGKVGKEKPL